MTVRPILLSQVENPNWPGNSEVIRQALFSCPVLPERGTLPGYVRRRVGETVRATPTG
jgi:hypothetical protein